MEDDPQQAAEVLRTHIRHWPRTRKAAAYPINWVRMLARSRVMQLIAAGLQLTLFVAVASPDLFGVKGWRWMAGLVAIYLLSEWVRILVQGSVLRRHTKVFEDVGDLISSIAGMHAGTAEPQIVRKPEDAIGLLLHRACELARVTLRLPPGCEITANLLLPVNDGETLPIVVGEPGTTGQTIAVLAMDATEPHVFDPAATARLGPLLSPVAQLIGLALITRQRGTRNVRARRRSV